MITRKFLSPFSNFLSHMMAENVKTFEGKITLLSLFLAISTIIFLIVTLISSHTCSISEANQCYCPIRMDLCIHIELHLQNFGVLTFILLPIPMICSLPTASDYLCTNPCSRKSSLLVQFICEGTLSFCDEWYILTKLQLNLADPLKIARF